MADITSTWSLRWELYSRSRVPGCCGVGGRCGIHFRQCGTLPRCIREIRCVLSQGKVTLTERYRQVLTKTESYEATLSGLSLVGLGFK